MLSVQLLTPKLMTDSPVLYFDLGSPYAYLWALPAFVRDPRLLRLDRLLVSRSAPRWFVAGGDLAQWGRPGVVLEHIVDRHYAVAFRTTPWTVMRRHGGTVRPAGRGAAR